MPNENYRENDILGGISYLSVFFAPVLFPLIVWIVAQPPLRPMLEMRYSITS